MTHAPIPYFEDKRFPMIPRKPIIEREMVYAIVINKKTNEVLCLDWQQHDWKVFVMGGIEEGEDPITSAAREVEEETGYSDLKFLTEIGKTRAAFYASNKGVNRISNATAFLFELVSDTRRIIDKKEKNEHQVIWIPKDKVADYLNIENHQYVWQKALTALL